MWKLLQNRFRITLDDPAPQKLFLALGAIFGHMPRLPYSLQRATPFVVARDFGVPKSYPSHGPSEIYHFQYGPRAWSSPIYTHEPKRPEGVPPYEWDAEDIARKLKVAGWEKIARALLSDNQNGLDATVEDDRIQISLSWQEDGRFLTIYDRKSQDAISYRWMEAGLELVGEPHPERLRWLESAAASHTFVRPIIPRDEGSRNPGPGDRAGQMDEFRAEIIWRYETRLDGKLDALLLEAFDRMRAISGTIGMAFAGHRFNDACGDDSWLAIRLDNFAWENGAYFRSDVTSLRSAPPAVHELLGLLVHLQTSGIATAFNRAFGYPVEALDVIGLFRQHGTHYFACCNSQGSCGPVYELDVEIGNTRLCGFTDRFDWNFNDGTRAGGILPKPDTLQIVPLDELVRRVETGDAPYEAGPPHDLDVPWRIYAPREDES